MSSISKDKQLKNQEKFQAILSAMLREEDNKYCADCDSKGPRWASWNLGVFLCIRCAGIHRNLGVHISRVKSVNLDQWTAEQIASMQAMGNLKAKSVYEAHLSDNYRRSQNDSAMEQFIRSKYEQKKWISKDWVPSSLNTVDLNMSNDSESKSKSNTPTPTSNKIKLKTNTTNNLFNLNQSPSSSNKKSDETKQHQQPVVKDPILLDFDSNPATTTTAKSGAKTEEIDFFKSTENSNTPNLFENFDSLAFEQSSTSQLNDLISPVSTTTTTIANTNNQVNNDLEHIDFNINLDTKSNGKIVDKQSILALYNNGMPRAMSMQSFASNHATPASAAPSTHQNAQFFSQQQKMPFNSNQQPAGLIPLDQAFPKQFQNFQQPTTQNTNINNLKTHMDQLNLFDKTNQHKTSPLQNSMNLFGQLQPQQASNNLIYPTVATNNLITPTQSNLFDNLMKPSTNSTSNHQFHHVKSSSDVFPNIGSTLSNDIWQ